MDLTDFLAGKLVTAEGYAAFRPNKINGVYSWSDTRLNLQMEEANLKMGELNAFAELVPNIDHFIRLHVIKEATVSSRIEGTQTNMEEALLQEKDVAPERRSDWREVSNYILAMNNAVSRLPKLPLSSRLLKEAHATLLKGARGEHKMPGEFRKSQNWIGGTSIRDAGFIPPVWQEVEPLMGDLENLIHNPGSGLPHIIRAAIAHYQFETIHPFLDGNGRIGRLMITLYFVQSGVLKKPVLYLSDFFNNNKSYYYDNLMRVRTHNDLLQWLYFFLTGVTETCNKAITGLKEIIALKKDCEERRLLSLGKKIPTAKKLLDQLFINPAVNAVMIADITGLSLVSSYKLIDDFTRLGILREITGMKRDRFFMFEEYYNVFEKRE